MASFPTSDLGHDRRLSAVEWERFVTGGRTRHVRPEIEESWRLSRSAVEPQRGAAPVDDETTAASEWLASPLRPPITRLETELRRIAGDGFIAAVTNDAGRILHTVGGGLMRARSERVHFVRASRWDEASIGTNALGLALRRRRPEMVFAAEHFTVAVHDWVCYSAPVVHRATDRMLGVIDLSTTWDRAHPFAMSLALMLARYVEDELPDDLMPAAPMTLELRTLGRAQVWLDGREVHLSPRQVEILAVLALHPEGLSLDALHAALYSDGQSAMLTSLKAEVSHLRAQLAGAVGSRPYRLTATVRADHVEVERLLRLGHHREAVALYGGPMLQASEAPAVVEQRRFLEAVVSGLAWATRDIDLLVALSDCYQDDPLVQQRCLAALADDDPRRPLLRGRLERSR